MFKAHPASQPAANLPKKKKHPILKAFGTLLVITLILLIGLIANTMYGNPISSSLAKKNAQTWMETHYPDLLESYEIGPVSFNAKFGSYETAVTNRDEPDDTFQIVANQMGNVTGDTKDFSDRGLPRISRLNEEYADYIRDALNPNEEKYKAFDVNGHHIDNIFGALNIVPDEYISNVQEGHTFMTYSQVNALDHPNFTDLPSDLGVLQISVIDEDTSMENFIKTALDLKDWLDESEVSWGYMNLSISSKSIPGNSMTVTFLPSDLITPDTIEEAIQVQQQFNDEYLNSLAGLKKQEFQNYQDSLKD